ncbi:MAG TPA: DUF6089 family protein [Chitinophagales bacterium]|nr:DUF6089 family protein [Chitinophagales bacterium]
MSRFLFYAVLFCLYALSATAQQNEFGIWGGAANYFGDLNTNTNFKYKKPTVGAYYRFNYDNRLSAKLSVGYASVAAHDSVSDNYFQKQRNLSFYSDIFEVALTGEFNFQEFSTSNPKYFFSPYLCGGFGVFTFDPRTEFGGSEYRLQPVGTEGQGLPQFPDREPYKLISTAWIIGGGIKYRFSRNLSTFIEVANRKTRTDYLDDVSKQYVDRQILYNEGGPLKVSLADRSFEVSDVPVGNTNKMRGDHLKNDDYLLMTIGLSFTIVSYKCPYQIRYD